jgi:hypothetical protein
MVVAQTILEQALLVKSRVVPANDLGALLSCDALTDLLDE